MRTNTAWTSECEAAHGDNWRKWLGHLVGVPAQGLELGTWMGESAEWMLDNIFTHEAAHYCCVDTFEGSEEHHIAGIDCSTIEADTRERLSRFAGKVDIFKAYSHDSLYGMRYGGTRFDFVYVDAAHDAKNVLRDAVLAFEVLKPGGTMVFDDYYWAVMPHDIDRPKMAVDAFVACYAAELEVIGITRAGAGQLAIRKNG